MLTSFSLNKFRGTTGFAHSHSVLNVGVGSLCRFLCVRLPRWCVRLGVGTRLACGAAHGYGVAATTVAKTRATNVSFIAYECPVRDLMLQVVGRWKAKIANRGRGILRLLNNVHCATRLKCRSAIYSYGMYAAQYVLMSFHLRVQ